MSKYLLKEISDEALDLKKLLQKYKVDFKQENISREQTISSIENMIKISQIIYAKTKYIENL
tara:strand:- start:127 stop:312 length:186 start_codon:yes stop_codon:yes gene_type:complete